MIVRLFDLCVNEQNLHKLLKVGKDNVLNSFVKERGTFVMLVANDKNKLKVFEIYQDESSYLEHISSKHFRNFSNVAKKSVVERKVLQGKLKYSYGEKMLVENSASVYIVNAKSQDELHNIVEKELSRKNVKVAYIIEADEEFYLILALNSSQQYLENNSKVQNYKLNILANKQLKRGKKNDSRK